MVKPGSETGRYGRMSILSILSQNLRKNKKVYSVCFHKKRHNDLDQDENFEYAPWFLWDEIPAQGIESRTNLSRNRQTNSFHFAISNPRSRPILTLHQTTLDEPVGFSSWCGDFLEQPKSRTIPFTCQLHHHRHHHRMEESLYPEELQEENRGHRFS